MPGTAVSCGCSHTVKEMCGQLEIGGFPGVPLLLSTYKLSWPLLCFAVYPLSVHVTVPLGLGPPLWLLGLFPLWL